MNPMRLSMWLLGVVLVVASLWMLFFMTGLNTLIPISFLVVGILLFVGLALMSMGDKSDRTSHHETVVEERVHGGHHH